MEDMSLLISALILIVGFAVLPALYHLALLGTL